MNETDCDLPGEIKQRQRWMSVCARAALADLEAAWETLAHKPVYTFLRQPETGSILVRGRAGASGQRFNVGEMTVTRCVVQLDKGIEGYAYVAGTDHRHAELAAVFDALLQDTNLSAELQASIIEPLAEKQTQHEQSQAAKVATSRVDFLTMVRGEG